MMMSMNRAKVLRHSLFFRSLHWAIFFMGVFLTLTGMQRGGMLPFGLATFPSNTFSYHIAVGLLFIAVSILVGYEMIVSGSYRWVGIGRIPYSFRYITDETRSWFGVLPPMMETILYDRAKKGYKEKVIPSVIVVWWAFLILGWILVPTGLALAFPSQFSFIYGLVDPIGIALTGVGGYAFMVAIHRLAMEVLVILVFLHIYATFVYKLVQSVILGYRHEPVV
jgi:F420-nonreducing hydrogenase I cytochrome b subunit